MDERVIKGFLQIRSELLGLVLVLCAGSMVVKTVFLGMPAQSCITENLILVGSPLYLVARSHMLGVTQAGAFSHKRSKAALSVVLAVTAALIVFGALQRRGEDGTSMAELIVFGVVYLASFCLARLVYKRHEQARQRKLDSRYGED